MGLVLVPFWALRESETDTHPKPIWCPRIPWLMSDFIQGQRVGPCKLCSPFPAAKALWTVPIEIITHWQCSKLI